MNNKIFRIERKKLLFLVIYFFSIIISCFSAKSINDSEFKVWTIRFSVLVIVNFILFLIALRGMGLPFFSVASLIPIMSYLFQFGDTFTCAIGFEEARLMSRIALYASEGAYIRGSEVALHSILAFSFGSLLFRINMKKKETNGLINSVHGNKKINEKFYLFLGRGLIFVTFPLYLWTFIYTVQTVITLGNYTELAENRLPGYITSFGKFFYVGLFVLMFYYKLMHEERKTQIIAIVFLSFIGANMALGARSEPMAILFGFLIFYYRFIGKKFSIKKIIFYAIAIYILASFMYAIQISRRDGFSIENIMSLFFNSGFNVIFHEIFEFGTTILSTTSVVDRISDYHPSWFFIKEILSLSPVAISSEYTTVASVMAGVQELGTSFIGEMYYYFGYYSYIACFLIAFYICYVENWLNRKIFEGKYLYFLLMIMWMWQQLNCIRASYNMAIKTIIYSYILVGGLYLFYVQFHKIGLFKKIAKE